MPDPLHTLIDKIRSQQSSRLNSPTSAHSANRQVALSAEELAIQIALEHLRQARYSFNLSLRLSQ